MRTRAGGGTQRQRGGWLTRRQLLGAGAASALGGALLSACGPIGAGRGRNSSGASSGAAPTPAFSGVTLLFAPGHGAVPYNSTLVSLLQEAIGPFLAATPGVRVQFTGTCCNGSSLVTQNLAGNAPDVSGQFQTAIILSGNAALDLTPYVRRDNVDTSVFGPGRLTVWQTANGGLYGLPLDTNAYGMVLNLTVLNQRGVTLPPKNWTAAQAQQLFEQATFTNSQGRRVSGGAVMCNREGAFMPESFYLYGFGGRYADPSNLAVCTLDSAEAITAGHWVFDPLVNGVCQNVRECFPNNVATGASVCDGFGMCAMIQTAAQLTGFDWDFWPMPTFPQGLFTHAGSDAYVIASGTKHAEESWELVKWLVTQPDWQRFQMNTMLLAPVSPNLWDQYDAVVAAVAPPLANKDLTVLRNVGTFVLDSNFKYAQNQTVQIQLAVANQILAGKLSVDRGFRQITEQINALQEAQAAAGASQTSA